MNLHSLQVLDYYKVLEMLEELCLTPWGKSRAKELLPASRSEMVKELLEETQEYVLAMEKEPRTPVEALADLTPQVHRAVAGGSLSPRVLWELSELIQVALACRSYCLRLGQGFARMGRVASAIIVDLEDLREQLCNSVNAEGEVLDSASQTLARLRSSKRTLTSRLRDKLEVMVRSELAKYLQEPIVTIRAGRYVLPVRQEYRHMVPGLIHDQSGSGATVFIEPFEVTELTNEIRRLEAMEREEIEMILAELSRRVGARGEELLAAIEAVAELDLGFAKARLALRMKAMKPQIVPEGVICLRQARHPLLGSQAVPIDFEVGRDFRVLIITGPNTGGKTVTLKTVGLLTLMAQSGLFIPVGGGSELGVFEDVLCDIGDEQSIEQNLSTFSSHMGNIIEVVRSLEHGNPSAKLVLLDELGAGTDPAEGAALGMAILDYLISTGARVVVTTHYSELKLYAYRHDQVENASMEFDVETLRPTYRLVMGIPGRSNALEVAARLGLKPQIIEKAASYLSSGFREFDSVIAELERWRAQAARDADEARKLRESARHYEEQARSEWEQIRKKRSQLVATAREEAEELLRIAREQIEEVERLVRRAREAKESQLELLKQAREALLKGVEAVGSQVPIAAPLEGSLGKPVGRAEPGMKVYVAKANAVGTVVSKPESDGTVEVQVGPIRMRAKAQELFEVEPKGEGNSFPDRSGIWAVARQKAETVSPSIDVRGKTVAEAVGAVDKYLDDAVLAGQRRVMVIHGKGTGALRAAIAEFLSTHPHVASWRRGTLEEGGDGVTVVEVKVL
ncbi:MAG: endonuclease MutS2 [Bacillota bacterium]